MSDQLPAYTKNGKVIYWPEIKTLEEMAEERAEKRIEQIQYWFDEFAQDDDARMALIELIELCGGDVPSEAGICTACGSDEARYTSHDNNNARCA